MDVNYLPQGGLWPGGWNSKLQGKEDSRWKWRAFRGISDCTALASQDFEWIRRSRERFIQGISNLCWSRRKDRKLVGKVSDMGVCSRWNHSGIEHNGEEALRIQVCMEIGSHHGDEVAGRVGRMDAAGRIMIKGKGVRSEAGRHVEISSLPR
eukprot:c36924_g1_i1 orf=309-764(+)